MTLLPDTPSRKKLRCGQTKVKHNQVSVVGDPGIFIGKDCEPGTKRNRDSIDPLQTFETQLKIHRHAAINLNLKSCL